MRTRAIARALMALGVASVVLSCAPERSTPASTPSTMPPTGAPTRTVMPTATARPSPTQPGTVQLMGEITLRSLPGISHDPQAVAVLDERVYVANRSTNNVSLILDGTVVEVIPVGAAPNAIASDSKTGLVYVANEEGNSVSVISGTKVIKTVEAPTSPACLAALEGRLYIGGRGENALVVLDGVSGERIASVPLSASIGILALAVNPAAHLLYASVYDGVEIVDLQNLTVVGRLDHDVYVTLGADAVRGRFFINEYESDTNTQYLAAYDSMGRKRLGRTRIGADPRGIAIDSDNGRVYVANSYSNDVSVLDGDSLRLMATVPVGLQPLGLALGRDGRVYVADSESDNVAIIAPDGDRVERFVPVGILPRGMAVHPRSGRLYVAVSSTNSVAVLEGERVVADVPVGREPRELAFGPDGDTLFVLNYGSGDLTLVSADDNRILRTVKVGQFPQGLALAPETGELYVGDAVLDITGQRSLRQTELMTIYRSTAKPIHTLIDARAGRAYMVGSNNVPGSNGGLIVYVVELKTGKRIEGQVGGLSMTGLALDPEDGRVFSTAGRFGHFQLIVDDARALKRTAALDLPKYPSALAYNPSTHHIFICLTYTTGLGAEPGLVVWVLDSRGLGVVARFRLTDELGYFDPYEFTVDAARNYVYLSDAHRGTVHVFRDVALPVPPSPTPTYTPTPWPTWTPSPSPRATVVAMEEPTCVQVPAPRFASYWMVEGSLRLGLGCAAGEMQGGTVAEQSFERGHMMWREADRTIFVLYDDGVWRSYPDHWQEGMSEYSCQFGPPAGLSQPKRGFGLAWCTEEGVREGLGWANADERGYSSEWQVFEHGQMIVSGTRGVGLALFADGTWVEYPLN